MGTVILNGNQVRGSQKAHRLLILYLADPKIMNSSLTTILHSRACSCLLSSLFATHHNASTATRLRQATSHAPAGKKQSVDCVLATMKQGDGEDHERTASFLYSGPHTASDEDCSVFRAAVDKHWAIWAEVAGTGPLYLVPVMVLSSPTLTSKPTGQYANQPIPFHWLIY